MDGDRLAGRAKFPEFGAKGRESVTDRGLSGPPELDHPCATSIQMPGVLGKAVPLPLNKDVVVRFTPGEGGRIRFGCGMNMMVHGEVVVGDSSPSPNSPHDSLAVEAAATDGSHAPAVFARKVG